MAAMATTSIPVKQARFYTPGQVAVWAGVTSMTIIRWCDAGILHATTTPGGHRRITEESVRDYLTKRGLAIPAALTPRTSDRGTRAVLIGDARGRRALASKLKSLAVSFFDDAYEALVDVSVDLPALVLIDASVIGDAPRVIRALRSNGHTSNVTIVAWGAPAIADAARQAGATHVFGRDAVADIERVVSAIRPPESHRRARHAS